MPDYDVAREQRQYAPMRDRLAEFRAGRVKIGKVIGDLEGLLYALDGASDAWRESFLEEWSTLEIAYAVALDQLAPLPTAKDPDVATSVTNLEDMVAARLA